MVMPDEQIESIQRALHLFRWDAVGKAEMPLAAKGIARDEEEVFLLRFGAKRIGVGLWAARKEIERAPRLDALIPHPSEGGIEQILIALVNREICRLPDGFGGCQLDEHRGAVVPNKAGNLRKHGQQMLAVCAVFCHSDVAQALPWNREGLAKGIADQRVFVIFRNTGNRKSGKDNLAVGLIRKQIDRVAKLGLLCLLNLCQAAQRLLCIDDARRVVGRVDDDGCRFFAD